MAWQSSSKVPDGEFTAVVYRLVRDSRYSEAAQLLGAELQRSPRSRAGLSLLAYCYYRLQEFELAAECYEQLSQMHPELEQYRLYQAQALYKACLYPEATRVSFLVDNPTYQTRVLRLQAAIKYSEGDLPGARSLVEQLLCGEDSERENDPDSMVNLGCLLYKEGHYEAACSKFLAALQASGYQPDLSYNLALAYYSSRQYAPALKHIADIIEHGIRQHPELGVGLTTEGIDIRSVGNTTVLHQTALVEAFNLKAAIEYQLRNFEVAQETLTDMPPRAEEELDPVTLHNQALMNMDARPTEGFEKLQFLLQQNPFPPETFGNLLLLYCKYDLLSWERVHPPVLTVMAGLSGSQIPDGEFTAVVYRLIRDSRYSEAAQALYKACLYPEATRVAFLLDNPTYYSRVLRLQAAIKYSEGDLPGARSLVEQLLSGEAGEDSGGENDPDGLVNMGCLLYKEGHYEAACSKFFAALQASGYQPDVSYNLALACYSNRHYAPALKHIANIIERGIRQHPELDYSINTYYFFARAMTSTMSTC
ncbi:tetratricopeptide repeat domain 30A1 [Cricetulus griseus]